MQLRNIGIFAAIAAISTAAYAANNGYGAYAPTVPTLYQTNYNYSTGNFNNGGASGTIESIGYTASYNSTSQGTLQARLCAPISGTTYCNSWGPLYQTPTTASSWAGSPASLTFFLQIRVSASTTKVLSPTISPSGRSQVIVNYNS